jgi:HK97 family phage prohead protease
MEKEIRKISATLSTTSDGRTVEGYASVFNSESRDLGFIEIIHPEAITEDTIKRSDVFALFNHDTNKVLARSKMGEGSLMLEVDEHGLRYLFEAPNSSLGDELLEYIHRGDIDSSSFAFTVSREPGSEKWTKRGNTVYRDIYRIEKLHDVSPVFQPAYEETACSARFEEVTKTLEEVEGVMNVLKEEIENL